MEAARKETLNEIAEMYNQSPLGKRSGNLSRVMDFFVKLAGMHLDHCAKERKDFSLMKKEKEVATYQFLGEDELLKKSNQELVLHIVKAHEQMIKNVGGLHKWN